MGRIVDVTTRGTKVRVDTGRLRLDLKDGQSVVVSLLDVEALLVSECAIELTGCVLVELSARGIPVVLCGRNYMPTGILLPLTSYHAQTGVLRRQIEVHPSTRARLWQRVVKKKIENQIGLLKARGVPEEFISPMLTPVGRGDQGNVEGIAARAYWRALNLFSSRNRDATDANQLLNYCYAVIHSSAARAICAAGLHPGLGLHHCNAYNACCLASDLMEPFRIAADHAVVAWLDEHPGDYDLRSECKAFLLKKMLGVPWKIPAGETSLHEALSHAAISLRKCILTNTVDLDIPEALCA